MSKMEIVTIEIDPETLNYRADFSFAYIGDLYIVLCSLIERFENGDLAEEMDLEDESGNIFGASELRQHIAELREQLKREVTNPASWPTGAGNN